MSRRPFPRGKQEPSHQIPEYQFTDKSYSWILIGHEGDNTKSPKWANDGSFLVFREIEQKVPEFNKYDIIFSISVC